MCCTVYLAWSNFILLFFDFVEIGKVEMTYISASSSIINWRLYFPLFYRLHSGLSCSKLEAFVNMVLWNDLKTSIQRQICFRITASEVIHWRPNDQRMHLTKLASTTWDSDLRGCRGRGCPPPWSASSGPILALHYNPQKAQTPTQSKYLLRWLQPKMIFF